LHVRLRDRRVIECLQGALQAEPVPAMQNADDIALMTRYKG